MTTQGTKRKLTAIVSADVKGYSRLMREDEEGTVRTLTAYHEVLARLIRKHRGRVVDTPGDNVLAEFSSVVDAVQCAVEIQRELKARNADLPDNRKMEFRIGINLGDVIEEGKRIYGDGVNIAARVEGLAEPGGICISGTVYEHVKDKVDLGYESLGEHTVKNIAEPVRVYRVLMEPEAAGKVISEKRPAPKRWQWMALSAAVALAIALVAIWYFAFRPSYPPIEPASVGRMAFPLPEKSSIAVLPFENLSGDPEQEYIADGISENIITGLSQISEMFVIARNSTSSYKGKLVKVQQVSEELGVRYVLEGSVQKAGDRLRVTAQLIDAIEGHHLWAERYDRELKDLFVLQDEITMKILTALEVKLTRGEAARWSSTDNFEAWAYFVRGLRLFERQTKEDNSKARKLFKQAVKLDPDYVSPWGMLGYTHVIEVLLGWSESPGESIKRSLEFAQKALALDETHPNAYTLLSRLYFLQGQYDKSIAEGERAIALDPNNATAYVLLAMTLHYTGRPEEAIVHVKKAMRLSPYYPAWWLPQLAGPYEMVGRYEEAFAIWKQLLNRALGGEYPPILVHERLALNYARLDRMEEARAHAAEILQIKPDYTVEFFRKTTPYKDQTYVESLVELLRKAGLPG